MKIISKEIQVNKNYGIFNEEGIFLGDTSVKYRQTNKLWEDTINRCVIHLIPVEDTIDEEGHCHGFVDSLLCKAIIYNIPKMEYYILENVDSVNLNIPTQTRIFKDLSTVIICDRPCIVKAGTGIWVLKSRPTFDDVYINLKDAKSFINKDNINDTKKENKKRNANDKLDIWLKEL